VTVVLVLGAALLVGRALPKEAEQPVAWRDLSGQVGRLSIPRSTTQLFRSRRPFARYLVGASATHPAPQVDFARMQLLLVSTGPRSSSGYSIEVLSARERKGAITVRIRERTPGVQASVKPTVTYPYRLLALPAGKDVYVDLLGR
jgi:hypothetical protein